jgi:hypothetical protein
VEHNARRTRQQKLLNGNERGKRANHLVDELKAHAELLRQRTLKKKTEDHELKHDLRDRTHLLNEHHREPRELVVDQKDLLPAW